MKSMKSHDFHVMMQRLLPIALKENLPNNVWACICDVSQLFQLLCSPVLDIQAIQELHRNVPTILCNLEKIFPPSFLDGMEHLLVHLPFKAMTAGPSWYRWMYGFERFLRELKKKVTNKAHVGASICQAYLTEEVSTFSSFYFEREIMTKRKRPVRNDNVDPALYEQMVSIFNYPGKGYGRRTHRRVVGDEFRIAQTYILMNCPEVIPYYNDYREMLSLAGYSNEVIDATIDTEFAGWFKTMILREAENSLVDSFLESLAWGPETLVRRVYPKNEPFILAQQAAQVYYAEYPSTRINRIGWFQTLLGRIFF
ncbi:unnamed protein product [Cuscuta epithymum]|uniref:DUF4218 domain-containing protein n=1 Tax=Cuscuta epithymum TaxID=186058 RepID=A0AAV0EN60_9ASTE|nr:unnamed protein product [Cuscuta epithymum]